MYGQTRILFSMSRDGMLPPLLRKVSPRTLTPIPNTIIVAIAIGTMAGLIPLSKLADLTSIGTLAAFTVVSIAVIVLRRTAPDLPRGFHVPLYPFVPIASVLFCLVVIAGLPGITWLVFTVWVAIVLTFYFFYGIKHSRLEQRQ